MTSEWQRHEVSDLLGKGKIVIGDGYRAKNEELSSDGLPFARAGNINNGFRFDDADHFPLDALNRVGNKVSQSGDVVFTSKGTVGRFAFVLEETPRFVYSPQLCFWRSLDPSLLDPRFLFYWMSGPEFFVQFKGVAGQTDMAEYVSLTDQRRMHISLPPVIEQHAIASLLGALDDKIELNRQMNETLEATARLFFKDWFVDFGPTRAKAEGRPPYLAPELWALFPDALDDDDKPVGWHLAPLLDHAKLISGGTPKTDVLEYWGGQIAWSSAKDVSQCTEKFLIETERTITEAGVERSSTKIVPKLSVVVVARGATTGRFCMLGKDMAMNQTCYALQSRLNRPFWLASAFGNTVQQLVNEAHGSVFDTITTATFERSRVMIGDDRIMDSFEGLIGTLFIQILANIEESKTLAQTRDLLLPKLMSGEIRLRDAQIQIDEVLA